MRSIDSLSVNGSLFLQNKSHTCGFQNAGTNQNDSEKPNNTAEAVLFLLFLRASRDNKVCLWKQKHMDGGEETTEKAPRNKLSAVTSMECELHMFCKQAVPFVFHELLQ